MSVVADINWLYYKIYHDNPELKRIVMIHSKQVARKAIEIAYEKKLKLDHKDIYTAAMLHDIGVIKCNAPDIHARGSLPYICHGIEGKKILEAHNLKKYAGVCERHTGAGISAQEIKEMNLPLPTKDLIPKTLLEKLICYADKFFSKSQDPTREKNMEEIVSQMKRFGDDSLKRFLELHAMFGNEKIS